MIETKRLIIKPLSLKELIDYLKTPDILAKNMGLPPSKSLIDKETQDAILNELLPNLSDAKKNPLFNTMWIMIEKNKNAIIGGICFHGEPDENGEAEIGYGTDEEYRNKGYMTETICGLVSWLKDNKLVRIIKTETDNGNSPSIRVLEKNNFKTVKGSDNSVIMKLEL